ncbi:retinoic acid-induced protein 2 [Microcaecilia unicolor]|uniref:Retinoic acid-induced protein 2 n=1 Tax=Microcaecilia unicolor TaxID=1415580 RepID=A0A6P7XYK7_9AMPH|nr:retinoic acid-induced protein 2 [Microcaecilia unicolor]XP_030055555.1 retinoic acid-induced protein 2 [Microcaecilia unicolor]
MEELYKDTQGLQMDVTNPSSTLANNKLENGVTQLITAEAWNINSTGLMKKALSPLVTVPAPSLLTPPAESQSGVALKVAATLLQPICLGDSPVVLPIHLQVAGSTASPLNSNNIPYVMTTQGPVPLPVLLEQHVFQHLNPPLGLPQGTSSTASSIQSHLFPGPSASVGQPQILDQKPSTQTQDPLFPPVFQTPAVLQDLFPSQGPIGSSPCQTTPDYISANLHSVPPQTFGSLLSPLVPPATLLVPYPVIVPLPVPLPIPIPIPIPVPHHGGSKGTADVAKSTTYKHSVCKGTQTTLEKEEFKLFDFTQKREFSQFNRHTVIKMSNENEALDLSLKTIPVIKRNEMSPPPPPPSSQEDSILDLSVPSQRKTRKPDPHADMARLGGSLSERAGHFSDKTPTILKSCAPHKGLESSVNMDNTIGSSNQPDMLRQQKWLLDQGARASCDPKAGSNIEIVSTSQTAKVIVSVKDAVPAIFCGKIKGLSGVSTKNFSFKRDMPPDSVLQHYDTKSQPESRENADVLRKPLKNRSVKLKKMSSQEIHILPIKKQRLAAFFPRK